MHTSRTATTTAGIAWLLAALCSAAVAESEYQNPVDGKTYVAPGGFKTYQPVVPRDTRGQRITTTGVTLLTSQADLQERTSVQELSLFIKSAEAKAYEVLARNKSAMVVLVQFNCAPGKCAVKLASQGEAENATLQKLYEVLTGLPALRTSGEATFQVQIRVGA